MEMISFMVGIASGTFFSLVVWFIIEWRSKINAYTQFARWKRNHPELMEKKSSRTGRSGNTSKE